jgi:hypothetical protein
VKRATRLDRGYAAFTARERFQLVVAADARGDQREIELLLRSCPEFTYRGRDRAFQERLELAFEFAASLITTLHANRQRLAVIDAARDAARIYFAVAADEAQYEGFLLTGSVERGLHRAVRRPAGRVGRVLRAIEQTIVLEGAAIAHGFAEFCRTELEVEPAVLITVVTPELADLFDDYLGITPEPEAAAAFKSEFVQIWHLRLGDQPGDPVEGRA